MWTSQLIDEFYDFLDQEEKDTSLHIQIYYSGRRASVKIRHFLEILKSAKVMPALERALYSLKTDKNCWCKNPDQIGHVAHDSNCTKIREALGIDYWK